MVLREQVTYLQVDDPAALAGLPVWIWMDDPSFYGFPSLDGATVKVAQDCGGAPVDPDERGFDPDADGETRVQRFAHDLLGPTVGPPQRTTTCLYTLTPDRDFVLDRLPGHPQVIVALGSAHAFKFAAWFGSAMAALVEERSTAELAPFALDRPGPVALTTD